jgi:hypothetical protein
LRAEDGDDLPWDSFESAGFAPAGAFCPTAAAAKIEITKMARKIRFMLDLTQLELIHRTFDLQAGSIRTSLLELRALPEGIILGCKTAGGGVL